MNLSKQPSPLEPDALKSIARAVESAEEEGLIEIVPVFIKQADFYEIALWRGAVLAATIVLMILIVLFYTTDLILFYPMILLLLLPLFGGILGALLSYWITPLKRALIGSELLKETAANKARLAFLEHEIFKTENRIGVLIFVSFFERRAAIIPDNYLTDNIAKEHWENILNPLLKDIKSGQITEGFINAIGGIAKLSKEVELIQGSSEAELPDDLITDIL